MTQNSKSLTLGSVSWEAVASLQGGPAQLPHVRRNLEANRAACGLSKISQSRTARRRRELALRTRSGGTLLGPSHNFRIFVGISKRIEPRVGRSRLRGLVKRNRQRLGIALTSQKARNRQRLGDGAKSSRGSESPKARKRSRAWDVRVYEPKGSKSPRIGSAHR